MFEDLEEEGTDVTPDSPDRAIAWAIWSRGDAGTLAPDEAWAVLHERYPEDARFLLLNTYAELSERRRADGPRSDAAVTPAYLVKKLDRVMGAAGDALGPQLRDLVTFGAAVLGAAKDGDAKEAADLRARVGAEEGNSGRDERDRAGLRLRRFEREVVKELHERTEGGKALGARATSPARPVADAWETAVSDTQRTKRRYSATERFERGELVEHPKFGVGVVTGTEPGKVVLLFQSGTRKLVAH